MKFILLFFLLCLICACEGRFSRRRKWYNCSRYGNIREIGNGKKCKCTYLMGRCPRNFNRVCDNFGNSYGNLCSLCAKIGNAVMRNPHRDPKITFVPCKKRTV